MCHEPLKQVQKFIIMLTPTVWTQPQVGLHRQNTKKCNVQLNWTDTGLKFGVLGA